MDDLVVGDRVVNPGFKWRNETDKYGVVIKCYHGIASAVNPGVPMVDVQWDDGTITEGHLQHCSLRKVIDGEVQTH